MFSPSCPWRKFSCDVSRCDRVISKAIADQASNWGQRFAVLD